MLIDGKLHTTRAAARLSTFLMFDGRAEEAMEMYVSLLPDSEILSLTRHGGGPMKGRVLHAQLRLMGAPFMCIDTPAAQQFGFTPATSIFVNAEDEVDFDTLYTAFSCGGQVLMEVGPYGFSEKFAWVSDRFGVSWQLNLP